MSSFTRRKAILLGAASSAAIVTGCNGGGAANPPPVVSPGGTVPNPTPTPPTVTLFTRKNAHSPTAATDLDSYRRAVDVMRLRPDDDPTSWMYQANIHGTTQAVPPGMMWNVCRHGSGQFLPWHRMFIYYFERIVRAASGDPNFALPFWDYSAPGQGMLPAALRLPANGSNALFNPNRNGSINAGAAISQSTFTAMNSMSFTSFLGNPGFGSGNSGGSGTGRIEGQPHNVIHVSIGGDMGFASTAARDPIFWLHHCNVDRLWAIWQSLGGGRTDPTNNAAWMNQSFDFFDETGTRVSLTNADILDTLTMGGRGYEYASFAFQSDNLPAPPAAAPVTGVTTAEIGAISLGALKHDVDLQPGIGMQSAAGVNDNLSGAKHAVLVLEQAKATGAVGIYYDIYLNLPAGTTPDQTSMYYVGTLDFFAAQSGAHAHGAADLYTKRYEIARILKRQTAAGVFTDTSKAPNLTFIANGMPQTGGGTLSVNAAANPQIGSARIEVTR